MANFPISDFTEAVSKVLSNLIPPKTYVYLFACIPGLFFETSVSIANPAFVHQLIAEFQETFAVGHRLMLIIGLFMAFVIGNGFMLLVTLIQRFLGLLYRLLQLLWRQFCGWPLLAVSGRMLRSSRFNTRRWVHNFHRYVQAKRFGIPDNFLDPEKCWARIAAPLLKRRYGVRPQDLSQEEWNALYWALAPLTPEDQRGSVFMTASEATGWCGLAATQFAPSLNNRYYMAFAVFLIFTGLLHDWYFADGRSNPRFLGIMKIRSLLREFRTPALTHHAAFGNAAEDPAADGEAEEDV